MTVFGDLETSVLDQLPAGRSPIASHVVPAADKPHFLARAWERVREEVASGHQAYVVCPRIGDDDDEATTREEGRHAEALRRRTTAEKRPPRSPCWTSPPQLAPRARSQGCGSASCTAACTPDDKDDGHAPLRRRRDSTSWSPPR